MADAATEKGAIANVPKDNSNVLLAEVMSTLKNGFHKLDRDGNGKITKDELKQDATDQKLSAQERATAVWLSSHYDAVADINYAPVKRIAQKDTDAVVSRFQQFESDLNRCQKLDQMIPFLFHEKSQVSAGDLEAAKAKLKDPDAMRTIDWAENHLGTIGHLTGRPTVIIVSGKTTMAITTGAYTYGLSANEAHNSRQEIKKLDSYSLFR